MPIANRLLPTANFPAEEQTLLSDRYEIVSAMENYRVYFQEGEQEDILRILRRSSDILIDNINQNSIGITVERDDAERFYAQLLYKIHREVYDFRPHTGYYQTREHF